MRTLQRLQSPICHGLRASYGAPLAGLLGAVLPIACSSPPGSMADGTSQGSTSRTEASSDSGEPIGWFEIGWGEQQYVRLESGSPFPIVRGTQGSEMFPMPLRGAEFYLPNDPTSWMDAEAPVVDVEIDIDGFNDGPGGHFKRIANYVLDWTITDDGTYQSSYVPILVPDGVDSDALEQKEAHLWVRVRPHEQPALELELDVVVTVMSEPEK